MKKVNEKLLSCFRPKKRIIIEGGYWMGIDDPQNITIQYDINYLKTHWLRMLKYHSLYWFIWTRFIERNHYNRAYLIKP